MKRNGLMVVALCLGWSCAVAAEKSEPSIEEMERGGELQTTETVVEAPKNMKLILCVGQSNMAGRARMSEDDKAPVANAYKLNAAGEWVSGCAPYHFDKKVAAVGPIDDFVRLYLQEHPGDCVGVVPCAVGGSPIREWTVHGASKTPGRLLATALARAEIAKKNGQFIAILWHQGETDAAEKSAEDLATYYPSALRKMVERLREVTGDVPFVAGEIGRWLRKESSDHAARVNPAIRLAKSSIPLMAVATSEGLTNQDPHHFDRASQKKFAARYYELYKRLAVEAAARHFIENEKQFHLGILPTEQSHPKTRGLSGVLATNVVKGVEMLLSVDDDIAPVVSRAMAGDRFARLVASMARAKASGHRIVFSGCGATGRLAILLDAAVKRHARETGDAVLARATSHIMTGGDYALVKSVEMFEDFISFGEEQARELKFGPGDVLVAISEGGETSSVIGTLIEAVRAGAEGFFVFNNPPDLLAGRLERCRRVIRDPKVTVLDICTGPMAVAGSTRMQATTSEMLLVGAAVEKAFFGRDPDETLAAFGTLLRELRTEANLKALAAFVTFEADLYAAKGRMTYFADDWLLDIFTDTTERSPTFKLPPFRPVGNTSSPVPWTAVQALTTNNRDTWLRVYEQQPMCLTWRGDDYVRLGASESIRTNPPQIAVADLMAFPVGNEKDPSRTATLPNAAAAILVGADTLDTAAWTAASADFQARKVLRIGGARAPGDDLTIAVTIPRTPLRLFEHLAIKLVLNNVSSAAMGRIGRLTGNWMSFVDATNKKLIDRSARLISEIAGVDYETACKALFETFEEMKSWDEARLKSVSPSAYTIDRVRGK